MLDEHARQLKELPERAPATPPSSSKPDLASDGATRFQRRPSISPIEPLARRVPVDEGQDHPSTDAVNSNTTALALESRFSTFRMQHSNAGNEGSLPNNRVQSSQNTVSRSNPSSATQSGTSTPRLTEILSQPPVTNPIAHSETVSQGGSSVNIRPQSLTKSPFWTPITCPPRNRPNQILLINSTSTPALTTLLTDTLRPILPHGLEVTAYSAPYPAPTSIETAVDGVLSAEIVLRDLAKYSTNNGETVQNYDGLLVAHYSKHPLIDALRESYDVPVIGIMEASLYIARMLGGRFGVISTSARLKVQIEDAVAAYGLSHFLVGVESLLVNTLDLLHLPSTSRTGATGGSSQPSTPTALSRAREELHKRLATQSKVLVTKGADTVILGSELLSSSEALRAVKDAVRDEDGRRLVNVVDAVEGGVVMLNGLIGMGIPTSKKGVFRSEREDRRGRGQTWL